MLQKGMRFFTLFCLFSVTVLFLFLWVGDSEGQETVPGKMTLNRLQNNPATVLDAKGRFLKLTGEGTGEGSLKLNDGTELKFVSLKASGGLVKMELSGGGKLILDERLVDFTASLAAARDGTRPLSARKGFEKKGSSKSDEETTSIRGDDRLVTVSEDTTPLFEPRGFVEMVVSLGGSGLYAGLGLDVVYDRALLLFEDGAFTGSAEDLLSGIHDMGRMIKTGGIGMRGDRPAVGEVLRLRFSYPLKRGVPEGSIRLVRSDVFDLQGAAVPGVTVDYALEVVEKE